MLIIHMRPKTLLVFVGLIVVLQASLVAAEAPFKAGLRYMKNPIANEDSDDQNIPMWYPIPSTDMSPAWNFSGGYPSATAPRDRPPATGSFPLIVFSPGVNVLPEAYCGILERLAANGYVVISSKSIWEYFNRTEWYKPEDATASRFVVIYARPRAFTAALDAVWEATHGSGPDAGWFASNNPQLVDWNATTIAMGHSLGSNTALIMGGMVLRTCETMNLTIGPDYLPLLSDPAICQKAISEGQLASTGPYNLTDSRIGAVIALDPGPSFWFPPGSTYKSWFTDSSFSDFNVPLLLSSMTDSSMNVEAAYDAFPVFTGTPSKVLVLQAGGSHNTYTNDCELRVILNITGLSPGCAQGDIPSITQFHESISKTNIGFSNYVNGDTSTAWATECDIAQYEVNAVGFGLADGLLDCHSTTAPPTDAPLTLPDVPQDTSMTISATPWLLLSAALVALVV